MYFHHKSMVDNDIPGAWPVWTPGARLAGFIKRTTLHCYTQNMKALGLMVLEKKIFFMFFPFSRVAYVIPWPLFVNQGFYIPKCLV